VLKPAGSPKYFTGWLLIAGLLIAMIFVLIFLYFSDTNYLKNDII